MRKVLFFILILVGFGLFFTSCVEEVGVNKIETSTASNRSIALAMIIDTTFTKDQIDLIIKLSTGQVVSASSGSTSFDAINLVQLLDMSSKVDLLLKQERVEVVKDLSPATVKKWMKNNPKETKEIVRELISTSPEIFEWFEAC